jgi:putative acetyltransferase
MKTLETKRMILRPFALTDLPSFYGYASKHNIGPSAGWKPHQSIDESLEILKKFVNADNLWAITLKNGKLIGSIGLHDDNHRRNPKSRSLGYVLDDDYWGQGLVAEAARRVIIYAFDDLGVDIISATHYPFNERSKRVIEKCGFTYEATIKKATVRYAGLVLDDVVYRLDRDYFMAHRADYY